MMARKKRKMKKKVLVVVGVVVLVLVGVLVILNFTKLEIDFKKEIRVRLNDEFFSFDGINGIKNGEFVGDSLLVDTSKIGRQEIEVRIKNKLGKEKVYIYEVEVYDDVAPVIKYSNSLETECGKEIDLLEGVEVTDNSEEIIEVKVEGDYEFKEAKQYELYYVAEDSSGNKAREKFVLNVKEKKTSTSSNSSNETGSSSNNSGNSGNGEKQYFTTSKGFKGYIQNGLTYIDGYLIANKSYSVPSTYNPGLSKDTNDALNKMIAAARLDGFSIRCQSGFRSYETQSKLYNNYVARDGKAEADIYSARPGHSEHQTGLSCDICSNNNSSACINSDFDNTEEAKWLSNNAYKYGLILRYPKNKTNETGYLYESWHFRYVGVDLAEKLYNNGDWITMEGYFGVTSEYE